MSKPRKSYALWISGYLLRLLASLLIAAVCFFMIWRVFISSNPPSGMKGLVPNQKLAAAFDAKGEALYAFTQEQGTVTRGDDNAGYFGYTMATFIPDAKQLQVVFRYNDSTLESVAADLGLADALPKGEEIFDVTVVKITDLTPENKEDNVDGSENLLKTRFTPTAKEIDTTLLYTYVRSTFDDIEISETDITVFLDVYYKEAINYDETAMGTLRLYHAESPNLTVDLSNKEKKALAAFGQ